MNIEDRLRISVAKRASDVILRSEIAGLGSEAQVGRALKALIKEGTIVKLGYGVYAKAKRGALTGQPIPVRPVELLAEETMRKLKVKTFPSRAVTEYNERRTTQVPVRAVINTGDRRITRKLGFLKAMIEYENNRTGKRQRYRRAATNDGVAGSGD